MGHLGAQLDISGSSLRAPHPLPLQCQIRSPHAIDVKLHSSHPASYRRRLATRAAASLISGAPGPPHPGRTRGLPHPGHLFLDAACSYSPNPTAANGPAPAAASTSPAGQCRYLLRPRSPPCLPPRLPRSQDGTPPGLPGPRRYDQDLCTGSRPHSTNNAAASTAIGRHPTPWTRPLPPKRRDAGSSLRRTEMVSYPLACPDPAPILFPFMI